MAALLSFSVKLGILLIFFGCICYSEGRYCYSCRGQDGGDCYPTISVACKDNETYCIKVFAHCPESGPFMVKSCSTRMGCHEYKHKYKLYDCVLCTGDHCNGALALTPIGLIFIPIYILIIKIIL